MKVSIKLITRFIEDFFILKYLNNRPVKPLLLGYFVTFRCNLKCYYCEYVENSDFRNYPELTTERAIQLLRIARQGVPSIAFSGGEPLVREDINIVVKAAKNLGYKPISLFTNGLLLPKKEEVLDYLDFLQISLDTIDENKQDSMYATGNGGQAKQVKEIVSFYARQQHGRDFRINLNAVVTPDNIEDIIEVYNFANDIGVRLTLCPQLYYGRPLPILINNPKYQSLIDQIIDLKRNNSTIMDIDAFLRHIRSFKPFRCYPYLTPRIYPNGELVGPCPIIEQKKYDLLKIGTWKKAYHLLIKDFGADYICNDPCFLPCYLETSTLMVQPWKSIGELLRLNQFHHKEQ